MLGIVRGEGCERRELNYSERYLAYLGITSSWDELYTGTGEESWRDKGELGAYSLDRGLDIFHGWILQDNGYSVVGTAVVTEGRWGMESSGVG